MPKFGILVVLAMLLGLWAMVTRLSAPTQFAGQHAQLIEQAEAARGHANDVRPPAAGWVPVKLMDDWQSRWPEHNGVVWYRLRWQQADSRAPVGLMLDYVCMAGAMYVNGSLVWRDASLAEPLSRSWRTPKYVIVDAPVLHAGTNEIWVRVSGLSAYQPGLGPVMVGDPGAVEASYRADKNVRFDLQMLDIAIGAVLSAMFALFWLLRRQDTTYGWYAAHGFFGLLYGLNWIKATPSPFSTTDGWQAFVGASYFALAVCYMIFLLRFADRRWPRFERAALSAAAVIFILALAWPGTMGPSRNLYILPMIFVHYLASVVFMVWSLRRGRADQKVLGLCFVVPLLTALFDLGVYAGLIKSDVYLGSFASPIMLLGMGFVLSYRFATTMKRVEGFNLELQREVTAATGALAETLNRQHSLELAHSRAGERLQLVRDLHDGFGGTLVGAISRLQQAPESTSKEDVVGLLKDMRDDLRLVIDTTAQEQSDLAELIAPLRYRATQLLEAAGIDAYWYVDGLDGIHLESARSLDVLRLLQEALTNVFKHSHASRVDVCLKREGNRLQLQVADNGVGPSVGGKRPDAGGGAGMSSMRMRAIRLGGDLDVRNRDPGTDVRVNIQLAI